jgi:predicted membrane protein
VRLRVPEDVGVRLEVSRFLAGLDLDGFTKRGSTYVSANYDRSPVKVRVDVNAAFGSIGVDWVR